MHKFSMAMIALGMMVSGAHADALHLNPSQPAASPNMATFGRTTIPIGAFEFCRNNISQCKRPTRASKVKLTRDVWSRLVNVNVTVNTNVMPMTDLDNFGVEERWTLPDRVGDCEDYVLEKKQRLSKAGLPVGALRVTVVYDENGGGHAVLTVVTDRGDFVLDNNNNLVKRWQDAELTYLKRQAPGNLMKWESLKSNS